MPTFSEISSQLDAALKDVASKKLAFDEITKKVQSASNEYQDSLNKAITLRKQLTDSLAEVLPTNPNVRQ
jgi:hypothetical protein